MRYILIYTEAYEVGCSKETFDTHEQMLERVKQLKANDDYHIVLAAEIKREFNIVPKEVVQTWALEEIQTYFHYSKDRKNL